MYEYKNILNFYHFQEKVGPNCYLCHELEHQTDISDSGQSFVYVKPIYLGEKDRGHKSLSEVL